MRCLPFLRCVLFIAVAVPAGGGALAREAHVAEPAWVHYVAERLIVDGVEYLPDASAGAYRPGVVLVTLEAGRHAEFAELLHRFELGIAPRAALPHEIPVQVPLGYETHWVAALRAQACVRTARLKTIDMAP